MQHKNFDKLQVTSLLSYFNNIPWVESSNCIKQNYNSIFALSILFFNTYKRKSTVPSKYQKQEGQKC